MKLTIIDHGDTSAGLDPQTWEIDCPFNREDVDKDTLEWFRNKINGMYYYFANGKIISLYDFEIKDA
ncbi:MAG: hypothetical protein UT21_C0006G0024 [Candidatus Woesebacteria bacterium GW2011_GWA1_39_11b]|nr:MAG: hypothetical protein UT21_C0006G0024 [Candidatus Woesebacteria bacterium GW2011_GWA1_39_11b]KKS77102.1 MAG: hypothetical protein UV51_C0010G0007 [Candidatus Woesebacteria bacterium GW2011_GWC1_42_9]